MSKHEELLEAIKEHSTLDDMTIKHAAEHGAHAGFSGFTYYEDTIEFYDKNENLIWELLEDQATQFGQNIPEFIGNFSSADNVVDQTTFKNLLTWFALEEAGHYLIRQEEAV